MDYKIIFAVIAVVLLSVGSLLWRTRAVSAPTAEAEPAVDAELAVGVEPAAGARVAAAAPPIAEPAPETAR